MALNYPIEVEKLVKDFEHWRKTRKFPKEAVPTNLIKEFIQIQRKFPEIPLKSICKITVSTINRYVEEKSFPGLKNIASFETVNDFSSQLIKIPHQSHPHTLQKNVIEIETLAGIKIRIFQ